MFYIYMNHMTGELYFSEKDLDADELYCESCGEYDSYLGAVNNSEELHKLIADCGSICYMDQEQLNQLEQLASIRSNNNEK